MITPFIRFDSIRRVGVGGVEVSVRVSSSPLIDARVAVDRAAPRRAAPRRARARARDRIARA